MSNKMIIGYACLALAASCWGGMYVVGKFVMDYLPPFLVLWLRYLVAFILLFIISFVIKQQRITKKDIPFMAFLGFVGYFLSNGGAFVGTALSSSQLGALIASTPPIFTVILASFVLKERLTKNNVCALCLAMVGVTLVVAVDSGGYHGQLFGVLALIFGALAWAFYIVYVKKGSYSPLVLTTYGTGFGIVFTTPAMIWQFNDKDIIYLLDVTVWLAILYLGLAATAVAFLLWNQGMQHVNAGAGSMFTFFNVLVGGVLGWIFLGETLSWQFFGGSILIFVAIVISLYSENVKSSTKLFEHKGEYDEKF